MNNSSSIDLRRPRHWFWLVLFVVAVESVGALIGIGNAPGAWYAGLEKPFFNPPNWVFAPVWSVLYVLVAIAGWRSFIGRRTDLVGLWVAQMVLNWLWSPIFFGAHELGLALVELVLMWLAIASFLVRAWRRDRPSAWLFVPYLAWVSFAGLLNAALLWLN